MSSKVFHSPFPDVEIPQNVTLTQCILQRAKQHGNKTAMIDAVSGRHFSYNDVIEKVGRMTCGLYRSGVKKGEVILLCSANCIEYPIIILAAASLGAIVSTANHLYTVRELYNQMEDSESIHVICSQDAIGRIKEAADKWGKIKTRFVLGGAEGFQPFGDVMNEIITDLPLVQMNIEDDIMLLPSSSGTTGRPKCVMITQYNMLSILHTFDNPDANLDGCPGKETYICFLPFFHIYGIVVSLMYGLFQGNTMVVLARFELQSYLKAVQDFKGTILHIVPPVAVLLSSHPLVEQFDLSSVRQIFVGAAPMGKELAMALMARIKVKALRQGYGMTEAAGSLLISPLQGWRHGSAGMLLPNTLGRIVDVKTGKDLDEGQDGELWFKGPQMMKGYHRRPDTTAETIDTDGWLHTGDIGRVEDDGHFFVVDRLKELVKYKGFQVAPAELESLLLSHPAIADAAVIGVPDLEAGELPRAFCVRKPGVKVTETDVIQFIAGQVSPHKRLRGGVEFVAEVPKSASGKILRRILRDTVKNAKKDHL